MSAVLKTTRDSEQEFLSSQQLPPDKRGVSFEALFFRQLPAGLRAELGGADLLVLKGDVNYRRLLEDRHWPPTARLEEIAGHMPAPFLTLRTLKAELIVGLDEGQAERLEAEDPAWRINGRRGLVHLVGGR